MVLYPSLLARNEMEDFSGTALAAAEEEREKHPTFVAPFALNSLGEWVQTFQGVSYTHQLLPKGCNEFDVF